MHPHKTRHFLSVSEIVIHAMLLVVAIAIAFSLPSGIHFFLYRWWPMISANTDLLFLTEVCLAAVLVAVFVSIKSTLQNRDFVDSAKLASLGIARFWGGVGTCAASNSLEPRTC